MYISEFLSDKSELIFRKSGSVDKDYISDEIDLKDEPSFDLMISKVDDDLYLDLNIFFNYKTHCNRCLKDVEVEDEVNYKSQLASEIPQYGTSDEDNQIDYVLLEDGKIDIQELIRQLIILSIPLKTVCEETCQGLCSGCGVNLNIDECQCDHDLVDERFAVLKDLKLD